MGCGAIGSLFAARLGSLGDAGVWAFDVAAGHVRAIEGIERSWQPDGH